jgi:aryl-alcohol dehydrogenase-like predicted oxidoreductase
MRYRPFGVSGKAVSAVSLLLHDRPPGSSPQAWRELVINAMECGINGFELVTGSAALCAGMQAAMAAVERRLLFLGWRILGESGKPLSHGQIGASVKAGLQRTGAGYFDVLMLDEAAADGLDSQALAFLGDLKAAGLVLQIGVCGSSGVIDRCIASDLFDVLCTPFNLESDSQVRRRIRDASSANMTVLATDVFPDALLRPAVAKAPPVQRVGLFRRPAPGAAGLPTTAPYAFLHQTPGWAPDELCLGYTLTEPAFATIQIATGRVGDIERLASVPDKDLPAAVAAQIEMARFGAQPVAKAG